MEIRNFIKTRMKMIKKPHLFYEKQLKNVNNVYAKTWSSILYCKLAPLTRDVAAQIFRDTEKIQVLKKCQWNTLYMSNLKVTWSLIMRLGPKGHPSVAHWWDSNWKRFNFVCYMLSLCANVLIWKVRKTK